jgi:hypothetical protein
MSKYCLLLTMLCFSVTIYADNKQQSKTECKDQRCAVTKEQPHPTPIHPCAPLEHCMPPSH